MNCNANGRAGEVGGAQTGCQIAAARLGPTCLFLPRGVGAVCLLQLFFTFHSPRSKRSRRVEKRGAVWGDYPVGVGSEIPDPE